MVYRHIQQLARVVRLQAAGRLAHQLQIKVVDSRLVEHDMGKLGQPVLGVLHTTMADDLGGVLVIGFPEGHLIDPAGLLEYPIAEIECLEHLHGPAGNPVGLPQLQWAVLLLNDASTDVGESRQLRCQGQPGRATADDQHIDLRWGSIGVRGSHGGNRENMGIAGAKTVQIELHVLSFEFEFVVV